MKDDNTVLPPDSAWTSAIRLELRDGEKADYDINQGKNVERMELQGSSLITPGNIFWLSWWEYFPTDYPKFSNAISGAWNSHGQIHDSGTAPPHMFQVVGDNRIWDSQVRTMGTHTALFTQPLDRGNWHFWAVGLLFSTSSTTGWVEAWRDGVQVYPRTYQRTQNAGNGYMKLGSYRADSLTGTTVHRIAGMRLWQASSASDAPPAYPGTASPPGGGTTTPTITIVGDPVLDRSYTGQVPYRIDLANAPSGYKLYTGFAPANVTAGLLQAAQAPHIGALTIPQTAATDQWYWVVLRDAADNIVAEIPGFHITVTPAAQVQLSATASPATATLNTGGQATVNVTGTFPTSATTTWAVNGVTNGNSAVGTLSGFVSEDGARSATYTAPASVPSPASVTVTCTITGTEGAVTATSTITVQAPVVVIPPDTTIFPGSASAQTGQTVSFSTSGVVPTSPVYVWTVDGIVGGNTTVGTITPNAAPSGAVYTAPAVVPQTGAVLVACTVTGTEGSDTASATVNIQAPPPPPPPSVGASTGGRYTRIGRRLLKYRAPRSSRV